MQKLLVGLLIVTIGFGGCSSRKKEEPRKDNKAEVFAGVDIPTADGMNSVFDEGTSELMKADQMVYDDMDQNPDLADAVYTDNITFDDVAVQGAAQAANDDFAWIQEPSSDDLQKVYFDFDKHTLREDQQGVIAHNAEVVKETLAATTQDKKMTLVIEGHTDHAAGSDLYNLALSERRAKTAKDHMISLGVPSDMIKIVGRGSEVPAVVDGKPVDGDRNQQWPNRRDEMRVIYS